MRRITLLGCLLVWLGCSPWLWAVHDEPGELNWERFGLDMEAFADFRTFAGTHPGLRGLPASPCPQSFPVVTVQPDEFCNRLGWELEGTGAKRHLKAAYGHGRYMARAPLKIEQPGAYRVWVNYMHLQGYAASFALRILQPELLRVKDPKRESTKGILYEHRFDWCEHDPKRPDPLPNRKDKPSGMLWESGPLVELPPGDYTVELVTLVHGGPFTFRKVSRVVLTADPLMEGLDEVRESGMLAACDQTKQAWTVWEKRPGAFPWEALSSAQRSYYLAWRRQFLHTLATKPETDAQKRMAAQVYFDELDNLIGTPEDVAKEQKRLQALRKRGYPSGVMLAVEAEDMAIGKGWYVTSERDALGKVLRAHYADGVATATADIIVPKAGTYYVWSRYLIMHKYFSLFDLKFLQNDKVCATAMYGQPKDRYKRPNNQFTWEMQRVTLPAGPMKLMLHKNVGRGPYTFRTVDRMLITDVADCHPDDMHRALSKRSLTLWLQSDPWSGFSRWSEPQAKDQLEPKDIPLTVPQGDVASLLLHVRNESGKAMTVKPEAVGDVPLQLRVMAYMNTAVHGWTPAVLLERDEMELPPLQNTSIWLTVSTADLSVGCHETQLKLLDRTVTLKLEVTTPSHRRPVPVVGGWCHPLPRESCWKLFKEIGINLIYDCLVTKADMERYGMRLLCFGLNLKDAASIRAQRQEIDRLGLKPEDWSVFVLDEPTAPSLDRWLKGAKLIRQAAKDIQIWCNPGEVHNSTPQVVRAMRPYIDVFCPYMDHFQAKDEAYRKSELPAIGRLKLVYSTPCFHEKASNAPYDILQLGEIAASHGRDGWSMFSLFASYPYSNSIWDEMHPFSSCQSIGFYPGAYGRTLSTRNLEAVREAIQRYRNGK